MRAWTFDALTAGAGWIPVCASSPVPISGAAAATFRRRRSTSATARRHLPGRRVRTFPPRAQLADATRRDIVTRVMQGEHSVSSLARDYPMSFAAVQKHVAVLERAALVTKRRSGREQLVLGNVDTIRRAELLLVELEMLWRGRIERFGSVLSRTDEASTAATSPHPTEGAH